MRKLQPWYKVAYTGINQYCNVLVSAAGCTNQQAILHTYQYFSHVMLVKLYYSLFKLSLSVLHLCKTMDAGMHCAASKDLHPDQYVSTHKVYIAYGLPAVRCNRSMA